MTHDNMTQEHCMLDTKSYKHTHKMCKTHCFSTATVVARTRLYVTLYVHCLSGLRVYMSIVIYMQRSGFDTRAV